MFADLPGFWTPVLPAADLTDRPVALDLAGERVVLFRSSSGVSALIDRCPHRGVALSLGRVVDGCLECPFHGWRFGGDGACHHVPMNPDARRELLGATALPVREVGGLVWVFTGTSTDTAPDVPDGLTRPGVRRAFYYESWNTHWTRAMENMLDSPHLPFVHAGTIGGRMRKTLRPDSQMAQEIIPNDVGFELRFSLDGQPLGRLDWLRPNGMALHILEQPGRFMRIHAYCVPEGPERTRMLIAVAQDFGVLTPLAAFGDGYNRKILTEDRAVVESSWPREVPPPGDEKSVPSDRPTLRFRSWYYRTIRRHGGEDGGDLVPLRRRDDQRRAG